MPGFTSNLLTGLAELLAAEGAGSWSPSAAYATSATGIVLDVLPSAPDKVICLKDYNDDNDARLTDSVVSVQVRCRGDRDPATVRDMRDDVMAALHARRNTLLGTSPNQVRVAQIVHASSAELGPDANGRHERTINFEIYVNRPDNDRLE